MAVKRPIKKKYGISSKILDVIRAEVLDLGILEGSDYYAKQANPKDGGYAKSNYITGDGYTKGDAFWGVVVSDPEVLVAAGALSQVAGATNVELKVSSGILKSSLKARKQSAATSAKTAAKKSAKKK